VSSDYYFLLIMGQDSYLPGAATGLSELQRCNSLSLSDIGAAVVVEPEGGLAVAQDVGHRAVGLAGVEHGRRRKMAQMLQREFGCSPSCRPTITQGVGSIGIDPSQPEGKTYSEPAGPTPVVSRRRAA